MRGFTLIELLVVITIMAILVVVIVPNYGSYNNNQKLGDAARQLQTILRQAQNNAQTGTVCGNTARAIYWDVNLQTVHPNNGSYTIYCDIGDGTIPKGQSITLTLPTNITISNISIDTCSSANISVQFKNVSSEITFIDNTGGCPDTTNTKLKITLSLPGSTDKKVVVEKGGGIYVEQ